MEKTNLILGIESSCDETAAAVVDSKKRVLSNVVHSQIDLHRQFGGVVPEVAARNHIFWIDKVVGEALRQAGAGINDLSAVAVTTGAGLIGSVLVGESFAKAFALKNKLELIEVAHVHAHIAAGYLIEEKQLAPPFLALVVSGGHTLLFDVVGYNQLNVLASTEDDAAGEAFDKVARALGLPYPGGPEIDKLAQSEGSNGELISFYKKPKPVNKDYTISFSGLKTAVINYLNSAGLANRAIDKAAIARVFSRDALDGLIEFCFLKARELGRTSVLICGGVAANSYLRKKASEQAAQQSIELFIPPLKYCGDNGAMIAMAALCSKL